MSAHAITSEPVAGRFRHASLMGKTLRVGDDDQFLESRLKAGVLLIQSKKTWPAVALSVFEDCEVVFPSKVTSGRVNLLATKFIRCTFRGTLSGVDFGSNPEDGERDSFGSVVESNFSDAILSGCRYLNTNIDSIRFPGFPHVVVRSPGSRRADVENIAWPGQLREYMRACTDKPEYFSASVFYLPNVCKLTKCTQDEAVQALTAFGGVLQEGK